MSSPSGEGHGILYALLGAGVLMVVGGLALESMPDELPDDEPPPPQPYLGPEPPPQPEPLVEPPPIVEPAPAPLPDDAPRRTLVWHVEAPGEPPVACVLRAEVRAADFVPSGALELACADGRAFSGRAVAGRASGVALASGAAFDLQIPRADGTDAAGQPSTLNVDTNRHTLHLDGTQLFVEELSVPDATITDFERDEVVESLVRLAVPTMVRGSIPVAIAMVRGTGRAPRPSDPVCELTAGPGDSSDFNCRVLLRCHGETMYGLGTSGWNHCAVREGAIVGASDGGTTPDDGDPRLELALDEGRLVIVDAGDAGEWSATFELIADPRLRRDVEYAGGYRSESGPESGAWTIRPFATPAAMAFDGEGVPVPATAASFGSGELAIQLVETERLAFGRGGRAIAGHVEGRAVWGFAPR